MKFNFEEVMSTRGSLSHAGRAFLFHHVRDTAGRKGRFHARTNGSHGRRRHAHRVLRQAVHVVGFLPGFHAGGEAEAEQRLPGAEILHLQRRDARKAQGGESRMRGDRGARHDGRTRRRRKERRTAVIIGTGTHGSENPCHLPQRERQRLKTDVFSTLCRAVAARFCHGPGIQGGWTQRTEERGGADGGAYAPIAATTTNVKCDISLWWK